MKSKLNLSLIVLSLSLVFGFNLLAVPKYTDKETALRLAKILDEGTFGRYTITSTYVQNEDINNYYISVILSDGSAKKWYVDQIHKWSRDDRLILSNNRALLFLDLQDSRFQVFNKNEFHKLALQANVFVKEYKSDDPLFGQKFRFRVKNFSLISPTETAFGRDSKGSKFRYVIDLYNGNREFFTYEDAYKIQNKKRLLIETEFSMPIFEKAYHITRILPHSREEAENGVSQFGVEVQFNQAIQLDGMHFPYIIYENDKYDKRTKKKKKEFLIDFTIPNSEEKFEVKSIKNLEYLKDVHILKDPRYPRRLILRSSFNPSVLDIPPIVYKNGENSIYINFFNLVDQSVLSRGMLLEAKQRKEAEQSSLKEIRVKKIMKKESDYSKAFVSATELHKESQAIRDPLPKIRKLLSGIKQFETAALMAGNDSQLYSALMQRNKLRNTVIVLSLEYVKAKIANDSINSGDVPELIAMLDQAESFTRNQKVIKNIEVLRERLNSIQ